ncbi:hypothetical protein HYT53_05890 [Candidatus Woesearchaeota archaeon]|nr:hypothetical protein [Candidatus Woesearchaeota archaeon]
MKGVVVLVLLLIIPLAYSISIRELLSRYSFSTATSQMNVTNYTDFMIDKSNNGINDTMVFELTTSNANGNFVFVVNLFDKNGVLTNETNKTLSSGANKLNITFSSMLLSQSQFNYSIKVYNSSYSLKYRKGNILTQNYFNYEEGLKISGIKDAKAGKNLRINVTLNSTINGTFEAIAFLSYNRSIIASKKNVSIINSMNDLVFEFENETIKLSHYTGKFSTSSIKIGRKSIKTNFTTAFYDFGDFAAKSYIFNFTDDGIDTNDNGKFDVLQVNASLQIIGGNAYTIALALYDLFGNVIEIKNSSLFLNAGRSKISFNFNGSKIHGKKLDGPFNVKYAELYEDGALIDKISDAYTTGNYNFNDFDSTNLPDLKANISVSGEYHYGIGNITVNFTFKNIGRNHAFNVFTEVFDNKTFSRANKSNIINANSEVKHQVNFSSISDFEITAIADLQDFVEELNESNNAERIVVKLNKQPALALVSNMTINETDKIAISLSASDPNNDDLFFSINLSRFSNKSNIFEWSTSTTDSGNYTLIAAASDGFLNHSRIFKIIVADAPEKDADNDGVNDSEDRLFGDEKSVKTSTINLSLLVGNSRNISKLFNKTDSIIIRDGDIAVAEFNFDFSRYKLNLTNLTIDKQGANSTGSLIVSGLKMPEGTTKTLYVDRADAGLNGICIKDEEISSIGDISSDCSSGNEHKIECDGTLQDSYTCAYNSTLGRYKVEGLGHSGIVQIDYAKPGGSSGTAASAGGSSGGSGGGGGIACNPNWQCSEWEKCSNGFRVRKCIDADNCAFPGKKPIESEQCTAGEPKENAIDPDQSGYMGNFRRVKVLPSGFSGVTAVAAKPAGSRPNFGALIVLLEVLIVVGPYLAIKRLYLKNL